MKIKKVKYSTKKEDELAPIEEQCKGCKPVEVCFGKYIPSGTIHIFCCKKDGFNNCICDDTKSVCDKIKGNVQIIEKCVNIENARLIAAKFANEGIKVCGVCVSSLFHNEVD